MKKIQKHILYGAIIVVIINLINISYYFLEHAVFPEIKQFFEYLVWSIYFTLGLYVVNYRVIVWSQAKFPDLDGRSLVKRFLLGVVGSAVVSLVTGAVLYLLLLLVYGHSLTGAVEGLLSAQGLQSIQFTVWLAMTMAVTLQVISLIQYRQSGQLKEQRQRVHQLSAQHESLKSQLSSHFLFNSLNVLMGLIDENPSKAQEFVGELSSVYRYVLEEKDKKTVPLEQEMKFAKTYMNLIKKRYEDGLVFELPDDLPKKGLLVPLSLQILLENCIKHNQITSEKPLKVKVYIDNDKLIISNTLQLKNNYYKRTEKGLANIRERYRDLTGKKIEVFQNENEFSVSLPILTKKEIVMNTQEKYTEQEIEAAKERVKTLQGFYGSLATFVVINAFLTFLDLYPDGRYDWAMWPLMGWGIGVVFHAIGVFGTHRNTSWKNKMIQRELEKSKQQYRNMDGETNGSL